MDINMDEMLELTKRLSEKYTSMESTSVTYDVVRQLMSAVTFCLSETGVTNDGENFELDLSKKTLSEAYEAGVGRVREKVSASQEMFNKIISEFCDFNSAVLRDTMTKQIPQFFRRYDERFAPHLCGEIPFYPLLVDISEQEGIDRIYQYLIYIEIEQRFLLKLEEGHVDKILRTEYEMPSEMIANICSPVLKRIIVNMILKNPVSKTEYDTCDYEKLSAVIKNNDKNSLEGLLDRSMQYLIINVLQEDESMYSYFIHALPDIAASLKNGAINGCLNIVI